MSLIININSLSYLYDYLDLGVHDFIVGTNQFSCRQALTVDYIELKEIKEKYPMIRLFVLVNALVEQKYLDDLKNHLDKLNECQIDGIIFQDFGVLQICNEKGYSFKYKSSHIICFKRTRNRWRFSSKRNPAKRKTNDWTKL